MIFYFVKRFWSLKKYSRKNRKCISDLAYAFAILQICLCDLSNTFAILQMPLWSCKNICDLENAFIKFLVLKMHSRSCKCIHDPSPRLLSLLSWTSRLICIFSEHSYLGSNAKALMRALSKRAWGWFLHINAGFKVWIGGVWKSLYLEVILTMPKKNTAHVYYFRSTIMNWSRRSRLIRFGQVLNFL